jgi:hypothetical protein
VSDRRAAGHFLLAIGMVMTVASGAALAQGVQQRPESASGLAQIRERVPRGSVLVVSDKSGVVVTGTLAAAADDALELEVLGDRRRFTADVIERVQWQRADSLLNGVLIGAGIGAIHGIYWLAADPNECRGLCSEDYVAIAAGGAIGALVDRAFHGLVTVYSAGAANPGAMAAAPHAGRRTGIQFAWRF